LQIVFFNFSDYISYTGLCHLRWQSIKYVKNEVIVFLGKVIGTVWSTKKDENLVGAKFLIVRQLDLDYNEKDNFVVAVDSVGAGEGEVVLVATGSSSRQTNFTKNKPVDAVIMAIVDKLDISLKEYLEEHKSR
jgi:carbon dioxide concentrating mechanism protein CcmL